MCLAQPLTSPINPPLFRSYLAGLSRVEPFSQAFTFLGGHRILVSVLAARLPVGPAAMAAGAEVLVNTLSLADPAAWSEVVPTNVLMPIIEHALPATAPVSVRSRALDVASALLVREPRVAPLFSPQVVAAICALVEEDFATFGYKTIFFLHCYTTSKLWDLAGLAQPAVIRAFVLASNSHHREVHGWLAEVVGEVVSSVLDVWDSDNRVRFTADLQLDLGAVLASVSQSQACSAHSHTNASARVACGRSFGRAVLQCSTKDMLPHTIPTSSCGMLTISSLFENRCYREEVDLRPSRHTSAA